MGLFDKFAPLAALYKKLEHADANPFKMLVCSESSTGFPSEALKVSNMVLRISLTTLPTCPFGYCGPCRASATSTVAYIAAAVMLPHRVIELTLPRLYIEPAGVAGKALVGPHFARSGPGRAKPSCRYTLRTTLVEGGQRPT